MARGLLCFGRRRRSRACVMIWKMAIQAYRMLSKLVWPRFMLPNGAHTRPQGESRVAAASQARPPPGRPPLGATSSAPSAPPAGAAGVPALLLFKVPTAQVTSTAMRPEHMASASLSGTMYETLLTAPSAPARAPEKSGAPHLLPGGVGEQGKPPGPALTAAVRTLCTLLPLGDAPPATRIWAPSDRAPVAQRPGKQLHRDDAKQEEHKGAQQQHVAQHGQRAQQRKHWHLRGGGWDGAGTVPAPSHALLILRAASSALRTPSGAAGPGSVRTACVGCKTHGQCRCRRRRHLHQRLAPAALGFWSLCAGGAARARHAAR